MKNNNINTIDKPVIYNNLGIRTLVRISSKYLWNIFGLISLIVIQRYYGYEAIGMMAFAVAYVHLFSILSDLGYTSAHSKRLNEAILDEGKCNGTYVSIKLILNFVTIIVILSSILISKKLFNYNYGSKTIEILLYLTIIHVFILNINKTIHGLFNAKLEVAKKVVPTTIGRFVQMLLKCSIAIFFSNYLGVTFLVGAEIVSAILILIIFLYIIRDYQLKKFDWHYFKIYSTFAIPVIFLGFVGSMNHYFDKVLLQFFVDSKEVGIYVISERIALFFLIISTSIIKLLFPTFSNLYTNMKYNKINQISNEAVKYISMTIIPAMVFLFIFAKNCIELLFGPGTTQSVDVLRVFLISIYIFAISNPYIVQITSTGHLKIAMLIDLIALFTNLILNCIFIPDELFEIEMLGLGALGASYTFLISITIKAIISKYYAGKLTKTKLYKNIWKHIIAAFISSIFAFYLLPMADMWYLLPFLFTCILIIYLIIMITLKEFGRRELNFYLKITKFRNICTYMTNELRQSNE